MANPVLKGASYALVHACEVLMHQGTTQTSERKLRKRDEYEHHMKLLSENMRMFNDAVAYPPNQVYIGNLKPKDLHATPKPWYENGLKNAKREGKYGEIMPQFELYGMMRAVDAFDLVVLEEKFASRAYGALKTHPVVSKWPSIEKVTTSVAAPKQIKEMVDKQGAEPLMNFPNVLVGCVKKAHDFDEALSAHVMFENLVSKASASLALSLLFDRTGVDPKEIDYIIECSEEACGDMNQRGGGNFAKSIGEICGCLNATGSDTRGFCAAPAHAIVEASALVQSGIYRNVVVVAGGASTKLGMNCKSHLEKGVPVLEDVIGAFAAHIGPDDQVSPIIRTDSIGRHTIGSGSSPQAVTQAIVADPLEKLGLKIGDVDVFSGELQNPEVTEPAGAGDVPKQNYKMIAALGVMKKEFEKSEMEEVVKRISLPGWAPTQGHIPSGVPFLAHCKEAMEAGRLNRAMFVGKGSLFLGRLTNLFDGVSFLLERNPGAMLEEAADDGQGQTEEPEEEAVAKINVGLTLLGSEHGPEEMLRGAEMAEALNAGLRVIAIGPKLETGIKLVEAEDEKDAQEKMDAMLMSGQLDAAVTMHYNFPIGVSTVGRVVTPGRGKSMYVANTTGASDTIRNAALLKNAVMGIAVAKACGNPSPAVGILNLDGAGALERALSGLRENGYAINFTQSGRADGGVVMRGNDLLAGTPDVMVMDSLTGNVVMKMASAFTTGGSYESLGDGYGPGVGEGFRKIVNIVSRASGAPVVAGAVNFAAQCATGGLVDRVAEEFGAARKAGLDEMLTRLGAPPKEPGESAGENAEEIPAPPEKVVTAEISGIDVLELDAAVKELWKNGVYASSGAGCTGPVVLVAPEDEEAAREIVKKAGYL